MLHHSKLQFNEELVSREDHGTKFIVIHHSEVTTPHTVKDIHQWHLKHGWAGIGYHYYIRKDGEIYEGRPHDSVGAHAKGHNKESVGVCFEGDFNKETMNDKQLNASVMLLSLLSLAYDDAEILGHHKLDNEKTCPGKNFPFDSLLQKVKACKASLKVLFGEPQSEDFLVDEDWRHFHDGFGDEEDERRRHNAPNLTHYGNFNYGLILNLFSEISEEFSWQ